MIKLDILFALPSREKKSLRDFLENFGRDFISLIDEYQYPEYSSNPLFITKDIDYMLSYLIKNKEASYALYWRNRYYTENGIFNLFVSFTDDGYLVGGLTFDEACLVKVEMLIRRLYSVKTLVGLEVVPPRSFKDFQKMLLNSKLT